MKEILIIIGVCICAVAIVVLVLVSRRNTIKQRELDKQCEAVQQKLTVLERQYMQIKKALEEST